ncbi:hypothetical protein Agub_g12436 [Astrephomene gubernaculifera]|uniref:Kinesin-like protein n=1 Tax=Astrephomene gubernaculifera TaxID=47775 RepID=A0AAD3DYA1_9CHLO|nr:hypothetical protein Agub_g12436 [Astrephomene gubernaculifera]
MDDRRESRIPRPGFGGGFAAGAKPLETSRNANTSAAGGLDRKRKAEAPADMTETKRPNFSASQGPARPTRSNTTGGRSTSLQQGASARAGPSHGQPANQLPPVMEEEGWDAIRDRTGQSEEQVLDKVATFSKGAKPERKVEAYISLVKEMRALAKHLKVARDRLAEESEQWKKSSEELSEKVEETQQKMAELAGLLSNLESRKDELEKLLAEKEQTVASLHMDLQGLKADLQRATQQLEDCNRKNAELEESCRTNMQYNSQLQGYNSQLQAQVEAEKVKRDELQRAKDELQGQVARLTGDFSSTKNQLALEREQVGKMREEREAAVRDLSTLRLDIDNMRVERERALAEAAKAKEDLEKLRAVGGRSLETLETLTNEKATMEAQMTLQQKLITSMREELAGAKQGQAMSDAQAETRAAQNAELKAQVENLQTALADAERRIYEGELMRRKLHNIIQDLKGNIRVYCRVRPVSSAEAADSSHDSEMSLDFPATGDLVERGLTVTVPSSSAGQAPQKHNFAFDRVFLPGTTQQNVFDEISELVQSALDGHKVCIFAYGQTGSGKTFTMLGNREQPGVIPRAMKQIFENGQRLAAQDWHFNMQASMLEIYNEDIRDLLSRKKDESKKHQVSHDSNGVTTVSELTVVDINRPETVEQLLAQAMEKRSVGCTALNEQSSRSHMVFIMRIEGHNKTTDVKVSGVLNLIDLAGSERVKESGATGLRLKEAQAINKSLSSLGDVIMAIANKQDHVPFRNSKLTYLLQPCLGGDAKTLMFLNVAPTREFAHESLCSLRFGAKVNACEINAPKKNVVVPRG